MRFVDVVLRQGHLSEDGLVSAVLTGERPAHMDRCARCAERAVEVARWLDDVRAQASEMAEAVFPAERLAAQQTQIFRRLEQMDEPARVIAFPFAAELSPRAPGLRRVAPAWVGLAAAAGLVIGVIGGQVSARLGHATPAAVTPATVATAPAPAPPSRVDDANSLTAVDRSFLDYDFESTTPEPLLGMDKNTPRLQSTGYTVASRRY